MPTLYSFRGYSLLVKLWRSFSAQISRDDVITVCQQVSNCWFYLFNFKHNGFTVLRDKSKTKGYFPPSFNLTAMIAIKLFQTCFIIIFASFFLRVQSFFPTTYNKQGSRWCYANINLGHKRLHSFVLMKKVLRQPNTTSHNFFECPSKSLWGFPWKRWLKMPTKAFMSVK